MNDVINAIKSRRSIRAYLPDKIKTEQLEAIVEAGIYAPTGCNSQSWHFTVIEDRQVMEEVNLKTKARMAQRKTEWIR